MDWKPEVVFEHLPFLLAGIKITISVSLLSMAIGLVIGLGVALARMSSVRVLSVPASLYIDLFRSTPLLIQLVWIFFALPILTGISLTPFVASVLSLSLYTSAYLAEIYRAGILSIASGQRFAGLALGMTETQALWRVVLPQAVTRMLPPIGSQFIILFKDSALVSLIGLQDLMWQGQSLAAFTMRTIEVLTGVAVIYMLLTIPQALLVNYLHNRYSPH